MPAGTSTALPADSSRAARGVAGLLLATALALGAAGTAQSHAVLSSSRPADGAVLPAPPGSLALSFTEPVRALAVKLVAPDGTVTSLEHDAAADAELVVPLPGSLASGTYLLSWRVVSADGHPVGGSTAFSIGTPSAGVKRPAGTGDPRARTALWITRLAMHAGLFIGIGGAIFGAWIAPLPPSAGRVAKAFLGLGLAATALSVGLQGTDSLALPLAGLLRGETWAAGFTTGFGMTAAIAFAALLAAALATGRGRCAARMLSLAALFGSGAALAASGHAGAAAPQFLTRPAVFLHALCIAAWAGSLLPLAALLRHGGAAAAAGVGRFSRAIPFVLLPLVLSGAVLAAVQIERPGALWTTAYGRVLLCKLWLLAVLFTLAAWNRFVLTPAILAGRPGATRRLRRSVFLETGLVLAILAAAGTWRFTPPPRSLAAAAPAVLHIHTDRAAADLRLLPGRPGPITAAIDIAIGHGGPIEPLAVTLTLSHPGLGIEPIRREARRAVAGAWQVDGLILPVAGHWSARIDILISDFETLALEDAIEIRR